MQAVLKRLRAVLVLAGLGCLGAGCSVSQFATKAVADSFAASGSGYATDDDIELVGEATPFALKTMESLLEKVPEHRELLLALCRGFTQYAYAWVQLPADEQEATDVGRAWAGRDRARRMYLRARDYGLRGLGVNRPGFAEELRMDPASAVAAVTREDAALLYWTGVAWAAAIALGKDDAFLLAEFPAMQALVERAYALQPDIEDGGLHVFLISFEMGRLPAPPDAAQRARGHFARAVALTGGLQAAPYVALAEAVAVPEQRRDEYTALLRQALAVDVNTRPPWRLANLVMQRRAQMLLARIDEYFGE